MRSEKIKIGTCSWNYDSWIGIVYSQKQTNAAAYLQEYSQKYGTAEIDSWFYKIPDRSEVLNYMQQVDPDFRFTCKVTNAITLTHRRNFRNPKALQPNPDFLSSELFTAYITAIEPMHAQLDAIMLEFEYLNKQKMAGVAQFLKALETFIKAVPGELPIAIEVRNQNYLTTEYFQFLQDHNLIHVFSEKIYMPHIYDVYSKFADLLTDRAVLRLLGGDRKEIEKQTRKRWHQIVAPKDDELERIAEIIADMINRGFQATINVNNHYEGSAPRTIERLLSLLN